MLTSTSNGYYSYISENIVERGGFMEKKEKIIAIKLPSDVYDKLVLKSKIEGYKLVSDYIRNIIYRELGLEYEASRIERLEKEIRDLRKILDELSVDKIYSRVLRKIQDMINSISAESTKALQRIAELSERIDEIESRITSIEQKVEHALEARAPYKAVEHRKTGLERLKEEGVLFESELKRLRDRDRFFAYLERGGAKIIEAAGERVAIDRDFWENFKYKLFNEITTNNDDYIKTILSKQEYRLFVKLKESGLIYYDSIEKRWKPVSKELVE